jgi:hypothetical protein
VALDTSVAGLPSEPLVVSSLMMLSRKPLYSGDPVITFDKYCTLKLEARRLG